MKNASPDIISHLFQTDTPPSPPDFSKKTHRFPKPPKVLSNVKKVTHTNPQTV